MINSNRRSGFPWLSFDLEAYGAYFIYAPSHGEEDDEELSTSDGTGLGDFFCGIDWDLRNEIFYPDYVLIEDYEGEGYGGYQEDEDPRGGEGMGYGEDQCQLPYSRVTTDHGWLLKCRTVFGHG